MSDNVIHLAFKNDTLVPDAREFLACKHCRNKTFLIVYQGEQDFPLLQCSACGCHHGHVGFTEG